MPLDPDHARRRAAIAERREGRSEQPQAPTWPEAMRALAERLDELLSEQNERLDALEQRPVCRCQGHALVVRRSWLKRLLSWLGWYTSSTPEG